MSNDCVVIENRESMANPPVDVVHWDKDEDNNSWAEARNLSSFNCEYKNENVIASGGTYKLLLRNQSAGWRCATCIMPTRYTGYTSAMISTSSIDGKPTIMERLKRG